MNKQPFYHDAQFKTKLRDQNVNSMLEAVMRIRGVLKGSVEFSVGNDQLLFTATSDVTARATEVLRKIAGSDMIGDVECEPGDPADLM